MTFLIYLSFVGTPTTLIRFSLVLPMSGAEETLSLLGEVKKMAWDENRLRKKNPAYYAELRDKYEEFIKANEFLTIPEAMNAVNPRTISLLTTDVKNRKLFGRNVLDGWISSELGTSSLGLSVRVLTTADSLPYVNRFTLVIYYRFRPKECLSR